MTKQHYGKTNRRLGHQAERVTASQFRDAGYSFCKTSRQASRVLDDAGIDLAFIPFNVQIKAGKQRGFNPIKELKNIQAKIKELFPPEDIVHKHPNMVLFRKATGKGNKRNKYDDVITMAFEDFLELVKIKPQKTDDNKNSAG